jgi:hypothetical protein
MAGQVEDERERRQDGDAERTPGGDPARFRAEPARGYLTGARLLDRRVADYFTTAPAGLTLISFGALALPTCAS